MPTALFRLSWAAGCFSLAACGGMAVEWPQYRGANHDGVSTDRITTQWNGSVTNPVWLVPVPSGPCSLSVGGARVFTQIRRIIDSTDKDVCIALSATNGAELWATPVDAADYPHGGVGYDDGPRSTPTYDNGSVYVLSSYLKLYRLNATNGSVIWQKDLPVIYGGYVIAWQNAASPLLEDGLIYVNLVDFDQQYGHRNDVEGYAGALEQFDAWLPGFEGRMRAQDLAIITADHGCDPTTPSTDHSREYVPVLAFGPQAKRGVPLGLRSSLADLGQTVAENFGCHIEKGTSFLPAIV